jgi:hypothetical protein
MSTNIFDEQPASITKTQHSLFYSEKGNRSSSKTLPPICRTMWRYIIEDKNLDTIVRIWNTTHLVFCFLCYKTYICNVTENIDSWIKTAHKLMVRWHRCVSHGIQINVMCILNGVSHPHFSCALFPITQTAFYLLPTSYRSALQPDWVTYCIHTLPLLTMMMVQACSSDKSILTYKSTLCHNLETIIWTHTAI